MKNLKKPNDDPIVQWWLSVIELAPNGRHNVILTHDHFPSHCGPDSFIRHQGHQSQINEVRDYCRQPKNQNNPFFSLSEVFHS